jgi:Haloacid dehalogenase-like hydrolase
VARVGLVETLTALQAQGIRLGIVANGRAQGQHTKIARLGIRPYLSAVIISEAVQIEKPNPRIFARALAEVGCQASQAWFVGDHPVNDILGAAAAGLQPIWLTGGHPWPAVPCAPYGSQVIRVRENADALSRFSVPLFPNTHTPARDGPGCCNAGIWGETHHLRPSSSMAQTHKIMTRFVLSYHDLCCSQ